MPNGMADARVGLDVLSLCSPEHRGSCTDDQPVIPALHGQRDFFPPSDASSAPQCRSLKLNTGVRCGKHLIADAQPRCCKLVTYGYNDAITNLRANLDSAAPGVRLGPPPVLQAEDELEPRELARRCSHINLWLEAPHRRR